MAKYFKTQIEEDSESNDLFITIPEQYVDELSWFEGDTVEFHVLDEGRVLVINKTALDEDSS